MVDASLISLPPAEKVLRVHGWLCTEYGCPIAYFHELDPLSELVSSLLSHRTKNADSHRAFQNLLSRFPGGWAAIRDAPTAAIEAALAPCTWPEQKAPRLQEILRRITEERGELSLNFFDDLSVPDSRLWLERLPGVGPKTSAAVLSFSRLHRRALLVDSHHHRVAVQLNLIPATVAVGPSHAVLEAMLPPECSVQQVYDNHEALMLHGQKCCFYQKPACERCPVRDLCAYELEREKFGS